MNDTSKALSLFLFILFAFTGCSDSPGPAAGCEGAEVVCTCPSGGLSTACVDPATGIAGSCQCGGAETGREGHTGMLFEFDLLLLDGATIPGSETKIALHGHDAGPRLRHAPGSTQNVEVVAW